MTPSQKRRSSRFFSMGCSLLQGSRTPLTKAVTPPLDLEHVVFKDTEYKGTGSAFGCLCDSNTPRTEVSQATASITHRQSRGYRQNLLERGLLHGAPLPHVSLLSRGLSPDQQMTLSNLFQGPAETEGMA
jgi:hypothetical protein